MSAVEHGSNGRKATSGSGKWTSYTPHAQGDGPSWVEVDSAVVYALVCEVTGDGDAVLFGVTRDGGALVVTICSGNERGKYYARTGEEMSHQLVDILKLSKQ